MLLTGWPPVFLASEFAPHIQPATHILDRLPGPHPLAGGFFLAGGRNWGHPREEVQKRTREGKPMNTMKTCELSKLPNVGKVLAEHLLAIGIETPEQLREAGAQEVFLRIRGQRDLGACLHMLYGIRGAILGVPDTLLTAQEKEALRTFFNGLPK